MCCARGRKWKALLLFPFQGSEIELMTASVVTASIDDRVSSKLLKPEIIINHPNQQQQQQKHLRFTLEIRVAHNFLKLSDDLYSVAVVLKLNILASPTFCPNKNNFLSDFSQTKHQLVLNSTFL